MNRIPLIKPYLDNDIKNKVLEVLESGYLTEGPVTKEFEEIFKSYIGSNHAIAVSNCTTGLEMALRVLKIGQGDEVIVPDYTYPATASVVPIVGAKAVIVDINKDTMLINYDEIENAITAKTKAIIPVSAFGNPLDYDRLNHIKEKYGVYIIEDAAPSVGSEFKNTKVGNLADISVFSFHPRKFITTGEGGMITTNNKQWAEWMVSYKHFGMNTSNSRENIQFEIIGTNYKLSNILAAIGLEQMKKIDRLLDNRKKLVNNYKKLIQNIKSIKLPATTQSGNHSYQSFCIYIDQRDRILNEMRNNNIEVQIGTFALHQHNAFNNNNLITLKGPYNGSKYAYYHCLTLPLYDSLNFKQQEYIINRLNIYINE